MDFNKLILLGGEMISSRLTNKSKSTMCRGGDLPKRIIMQRDAFDKFSIDDPDAAVIAYYPEIFLFQINNPFEYTWRGTHWDERVLEAGTVETIVKYGRSFGINVIVLIAPEDIALAQRISPWLINNTKAVESGS